jgi:hypothetical protein
MSDKTTSGCTKEYIPVCGLNDPAKIQCIRAPCGMTYSNRCMACLNENVLTVELGSCEQLYPLPATNTTPSTSNPIPNTTYYICRNEDRGALCDTQYIGVCAFFANTVTCDHAPCMNTYGNQCSACSDLKVDKVVQGVCSKEAVNVKDISEKSLHFNYILLLYFLLFRLF